MTPRLSPRRRWFLGAAIAGVLLTMAVPVDAAPLPLSDPPTATLSCDGTVSTLTMHWPAGEYGDWSIGDPNLGSVSGSGGIFTVPTDESFPVAAGWQAWHSTVRLNRDTVGNTSYNQSHVTVDGASCPFSTPVSAAIICSTRALAVTVPAGHVTTIDVYDQDGNVVFTQYYPRYTIWGDLEEDVLVGPVVIDASVPISATSVRVDLTVDNTQLSTSLDTSCLPPSVGVLGSNGEIDEITACDGSSTTQVTAGAAVVERSGRTDEAITVGLAYSGDLAADLAGSLPASVDFEAGEEQVLVPIESASPGSVLVAVVGGAGYTVGVRSSADVAIEAVASAQVCGEEPTDDPAGIDPTDTPRTTPLPAAPGLAPPAQAITGPAHLAG